MIPQGTPAEAVGGMCTTRLARAMAAGKAQTPAFNPAAQSLLSSAGCKPVQQVRAALHGSGFSPERDGFDGLPDNGSGRRRFLPSSPRARFQTYDSVRTRASCSR